MDESYSVFAFFIKRWELENEKEMEGCIVTLFCAC